MHAAAVWGTTRGWHHNASLVGVCVCVCVHASMCVFVLQAQSAGQDKYAFKRLIFHFRNWRRQNGSILSWRTQHKAWRGGNKNIKEGKEARSNAVCVLAQRKEAQSRAFVVCARTQLSETPNIWNPKLFGFPALLISMFVFCTVKSRNLMKAAKSACEGWTKVTSQMFQKERALTRARQADDTFS